MHAYAAQSPGSNGLPLALACRHADHCLQCLSLLLPTAARLFFIACLHEQRLHRHLQLRQRRAAVRCRMGPTPQACRRPESQ